MKEIKVGIVTHYFTKIQVAAIKVTENQLEKGEEIHIKGHTTDFYQKVESMQKEHQEIETAFPGDEIGIKVKEHARQGDIVYKLVEE